MQTIHENFGIPVRYYALVHMSGLVRAVDALGGVDLQAPVGGWGAGQHRLDGTQALECTREKQQ